MRRWVDCSVHGRQEWKGHLICSSCGAIYQSPPDDPFRFPSDCPCGARLAPGKYVDDKEVPFSARPVCEDCARARRAS